MDKEDQVGEANSNSDLPSEKGSVDNQPSKAEDDFPEGGLRAWLVVAGASSVLFCGMGYANAFGYVLAHAYGKTIHTVQINH